MRRRSAWRTRFTLTLPHPSPALVFRRNHVANPGMRPATAHDPESMHAFRFAAGPLFLSSILGCMPSKEARSAGEVGCSPDEIMISEDRYHFGLVQSSQTWVATCRGRSFICSQLNETDDDDGLGHLLAAKRVSCTEEAPSPQEVRNKEMYAEAQRRAMMPPRSPPPEGAAGFEFGASAERVRLACEAAGHEWNAVGAENGWCSGPAKDLGMPVSVALRFCKDRACRISLEHRPSSKWSSKVAMLKASLVSKYGDPKQRTPLIPEKCRGEVQFEQCLETRELTLRYEWAWPTGALIEMNVGKNEGAEPAAIRVLYRRGGRPVDESAL